MIAVSPDQGCVGEVLECVPSYKYLGLIFSTNGNLEKMLEKPCLWLDKQSAPHTTSLPDYLFDSLINTLSLSPYMDVPYGEFHPVTVLLG